MNILLKDYLLTWGIGPETAVFWSLALSLSGLVLGALFLGMLFKKIALGSLRSVVRHSRATWDDIVLNDKFFSVIGWLAAPLILQLGLLQLKLEGESFLPPLQLFLKVVLIFLSARLADVLLGNLQVLFQTDPKKKHIPIAGYIQVTKVLIYLLAFVFGAAALLNQDPWGIVSSIGALTAVILLVFKDSLLGLTASVQISSNNLVNLGDHIEVPAYGADGEVIDINISQIKVRNWNHTISAIPTYSLVSGAFKNWRGVKETGARRIKRALPLDMNTVRFLTDEEVLRLEARPFLQDYFSRTSKKPETGDWNSWDHERPTNSGAFRAYVEAYLKNHPHIHQDYHLVVRQLEPKDTGLPLELYCFSNLTDSTAFEGLQSDIFDHLLSVLPQFGLKVYQAPSGRDFRTWNQTLENT